MTELKKPFAASDHEFLNGLTYLREEPITERIEQIDPAWSFTVHSVAVRDNAGQGGKDIYTVTVHAAMTIKGVTRENVGMAVVQKTDLKDEMVWNNQTRKKEPTGVQYTSEANEAEKSATTDALKRCSRLFGIGRYLLTLPKDVKDEHSLQQWLDNGMQSEQPRQGRQSQPSNVRTLPPQQTGVQVQEWQYGKSTLQVFTKETAAKDKRYMTVSGVSIWSRKPFEALGFNEQMIEQLGDIGEHILPHSVTPVYVMDKNYKKLVQLRRDDTGEIVDADGKPIDQPQAANQ